MFTWTDLSLLTYFTPTRIHSWNSQQLWAADLDPPCAPPRRPLFSDERNEAAGECFSVRLGMGDEKRAGMEGEVMGSYTVALYTDTDVSLSSLLRWLAPPIEQVVPVILLAAHNLRGAGRPGHIETLV